jgi:hypothetical protein
LWGVVSSLDLKRAHNPKVAGSNPAPATNENKGLGIAPGALSPSPALTLPETLPYDPQDGDGPHRLLLSRLRTMNQRPQPHLPNAPITEALLDSRVGLPSGTRLKQLDAMHASIRDRYPKRRTRRRIEGTLESQGDDLRLTPSPAKEDGYLFSSADGKRIVQARLDGFTFNRLKPYDTWEALRDEAKGALGAVHGDCAARKRHSYCAPLHQSDRAPPSASAVVRL